MIDGNLMVTPEKLVSNFAVQKKSQDQTTTENAYRILQAHKQNGEIVFAQQPPEIQNKN